MSKGQSPPPHGRGLFCFSRSFIMTCPPVKLKETSHLVSIEHVRWKDDGTAKVIFLRGTEEYLSVQTSTGSQRIVTCLFINSRRSFSSISFAGTYILNRLVKPASKLFIFGDESWLICINYIAFLFLLAHCRTYCIVFNKTLNVGAKLICFFWQLCLGTNYVEAWGELTRLSSHLRVLA
jgi:hypothetical protein